MTHLDKKSIMKVTLKEGKVTIFIVHGVNWQALDSTGGSPIIYLIVF